MIGSIYKISSPNCIECYGGSTTKSLNHRFLVHKHISNKCKSKYIIDKGDAIIELIEEYECNGETKYERKLQLRQREQQVINQLREQGYILSNINNAYTSPEQKKQHKIELNKQYREEHKELIKQYRENNKLYYIAYQKQYRENNKRTNS